MKAMKLFAGFSSYLVVALSAHAQTSFQNLNFESGNLSNPTGMYNEVPITQALPGWNGSIGGVAVTEVWADGNSLGTATICVESPGTENGIGPIDGNYSVFLQAFDSSQGNVSLWQAGTIPANSRSLEFSLFSVYPTANFAVSFAGNSLSPVVVSSGESQDGLPYAVYGVNIATYAGQAGQLEFTALDNNGVNPGNIELDDITFSTTAVTTEPNTLALAVMGGLALAARRWRKMRL
jgi:hypothetical protein